MAGRHTAKGSSSKLPIIIISVAAVVVVAAVIVLAVFLNSNTNTKTESNSAEATTAVTVAQQEAWQETTVQSEASDETKAEESNESEARDEEATQAQIDEEAKDIVVPTMGGTIKSAFNSTYIPYKAIDSSNDEEVPLREFFGSNYTDGVLTFNDDGTFSDTITSNSADSGAYAVEDDSIIITYTNDKNVFITVNSWDGDTPTDITVHYGECDVYFNN